MFLTPWTTFITLVQLLIEFTVFLFFLCAAAPKYKDNRVLDGLLFVVSFQASFLFSISSQRETLAKISDKTAASNKFKILLNQLL